MDGVLVTLWSPPPDQGAGPVLYMESTPGSTPLRKIETDQNSQRTPATRKFDPTWGGAMIPYTPDR